MTASHVSEKLYIFFSRGNLSRSLAEIVCSTGDFFIKPKGVRYDKISAYTPFWFCSSFVPPVISNYYSKAILFQHHFVC